jgi:hypothetical protein
MRDKATRPVLNCVYMPERRTRRVPPAVGLVLGCILAGCGSSSPATLNPGRVEQAIATSILAQRHVTAAVSCPSGVPVVPHRQFRCVAEVGSQNTPFLVTEGTKLGDVAFVGISPAAGPLIDRGRVASAIQRSILVERHLRLTVRCPSDIPQQRGLSFVCIAKTPSGAATDFVVQQKDDRGDVTYRAP